MDGFELFKQGAEAKLYKGTYLGKPALIKERFVKKYRQPELDNRITNERLKSEARIIERCFDLGINTPTLYLVDLERRIIIMEYFENACILKDFFAQVDDAKLEQEMCSAIGKGIAEMHKNNIIHGDLTTSNILKLEMANVEEKTPKLIFIDFGLAHLESKAEDKGVDLYVLERALISTHENGVEIFDQILSAYFEAYGEKGKDVLKKFEEVRARGRKRTMIG